MNSVQVKFVRDQVVTIFMEEKSKERHQERRQEHFHLIQIQWRHPWVDGVVVVVIEPRSSSQNNQRSEHRVVVVVMEHQASVKSACSF